MSDTTASTTLRPPSLAIGPVAWLRSRLFSSWWSTVVTLVLLYCVIRLGITLLDWGVLRAVWSVPMKGNAPDPSACRVADAGACWAVIGEKYRFILFGRYPFYEQWRPAICVVLFIALYVISALRFFWTRWLAWIWAGTLLVIFVLMWGGILGMTYVPQDEWGGLPITLILTTFGGTLAFPLGILVALGRRSTQMPAVRAVCIAYVELVRGVPLVALLFMASVMFPLFMPEGLNPDKLLRAQVALILFAAAYLAEVIRGGLQAVPKGQYEAADALGLSYWQKMRLIILPQALRIVIPPLVNLFNSLFKDTSLVLIIGIFDLLSAGKISFADPAWQGFGYEVYLVLAAIYFVFCFAMSKYSAGLEQDFSRAKRR